MAGHQAMGNAVDSGNIGVATGDHGDGKLVLAGHLDFAKKKRPFWPKGAMMWRSTFSPDCESQSLMAQMPPRRSSSIRAG